MYVYGHTLLLIYYQLVRLISLVTLISKDAWLTEFQGKQRNNTLHDK
jgi:hypothetical protein